MLNAVRSAPMMPTIEIAPSNIGLSKIARNRFQPDPRRRLRLNARDLRVLAFLYDNSLASRSQLQELFYGSRAYCNSRLRDLFDHALVLRHFPAVTKGGHFGEEAVYSVGPGAVPLLAEHLEEPFEAVKAHVRRREAPLFVAHTLRTIDIYLSLRRDARAANVEVERWMGEVRARHDYEMRQAHGKWNNESFKPDGFLRLRDAAGYLSAGCHGVGCRCYFIECDMGHASQRQWHIKVAAHRRYLETGLFASTYGDTAFQTLAVTTGEHRLSHLLDATCEAGGTFFRFTTFAALQQQGAFAAIWQAPDGSSPAPLLCGFSF